MYKFKQEKLTPSNIQLSCDNIKKEIIDSIDYENRRVNEDSAKKRAVIQGKQYNLLL